MRHNFSGQEDEANPGLPTTGVFPADNLGRSQTEIWAQ